MARTRGERRGWRQSCHQGSPCSRVTGVTRGDESHGCSYGEQHGRLPPLAQDAEGVSCGHTAQTGRDEKEWEQASGLVGVEHVEDKDGPVQGENGPRTFVENQESIGAGVGAGLHPEIRSDDCGHIDENGCSPDRS
jgi:hypothetical protein